MSELTLSPELLQISAEVQEALKIKNRLLLLNQPLFRMVCHFRKMLRRQLK